MAWPTVGVKDLEDRWRTLTDEEKTVAEKRLGDAEAEVQYELQQRGVIEPPEDPLWASRYVRTVVEMVRRYLLNPEAWLEESGSIDDFRETRRRDSAVSSGLLYISEDEINSLLPFARRRRGAFSIVLGRS